MDKYDFNSCVEHDGQIYCIAKDGSLVTISIKELEYKDCPECVIKALFKRAASKSERSVK